MKPRMRSSIGSFLGLLLAFPPLSAVEFDCLPLPAVPDERPAACDDPEHPFYDPLTFWCICLKSGLTPNRAGQPAVLEQAIIEVVGQPTIGNHVLTVPHGTLDLSEVSPGDEIGQLLVDVPGGPLGLPENFYLDWKFIVTDVDENALLFDAVVVATNATSRAVLRYDPQDVLHAGGLTYRGGVTSFGGESGFELTFYYISSFDELPLGANSTGLQIGDLTDPGFSVPVLLSFPQGPAVYTLSALPTLEIETRVDQILTDPLNPVQRVFLEELEVDLGPPAPTFRRGDANGDGASAEIADAVSILDHLFRNADAPACPDAADANDDGGVDISDPLYILFYRYAGGPAPQAPGPASCGMDPGADALGPCTYNRC